MYEQYAGAGYDQTQVAEQDIYMSATDGGGAGGPSWEGFKIWTWKLKPNLSSLCETLYSSAVLISAWVGTGFLLSLDKGF